MIRISTSCKINLGLRITGRLANGYHTLESIFYPLPWPRDELHIESTDSAGLELDCPGLDPVNNTVFKAWKLFSNAAGKRLGLRVKLMKRVPQGSGLGGGSANGAAVLNYLNDHYGRPLDQDGLRDMALRLGADMPFFLQDRPCAVSGVGAIIEPVILNCQGRWLTLVYPGFASDTARAYAAFDEMQKSRGGVLRESLTNGRNPAKSPFPAGGWAGPLRLDLGALYGGSMANDLEKAVFAVFPALARIKEELLHMGAEQASMSGSGSSVFGIFATNGSARSAAQTLRQKWPQVYCMPLNNIGM